MDLAPSPPSTLTLPNAITTLVNSSQTVVHGPYSAFLTMFPRPAQSA